MYLMGFNKVVRSYPYVFWAERGRIHVEDERNNGYKSISVPRATRRLAAIAMANKTAAKQAAHNDFWWDEVERRQRFVEEMLMLIETAKVQGEPEDPTTIRDFEIMRPKQVSMVGVYADKDVSRFQPREVRMA